MGPLNEGLRPTRAIVDLGRIQHNFREMRSLLAPGAFFCPMVKANAYGHGDFAVSKALREAGASHLGVALIEEGLHLRRVNDRGGILVFGAFLDSLGAEAMIDYDLTPVLGNWQQVAALDEALGKRTPESRVRIHFEFNTGMNRLGFRVDDAEKVRAWLDAQPAVKLEGVCTHLQNGEDVGVRSGFSETQLQLFSKALTAFRGLKFHAHALNSSGEAAGKIHESPSFQASIKEFGPLGGRPGIAIYGIQPARQPELKLDLRPALTWISRIVSVNAVAKGQSVSYDGTWTAPRDSIIGVVPLGYADGYSRALSNRGSILCRGQRVPVVGTVCMDYFMVDLTDIAQTLSTGAAAGSKSGAPIGDDVVLIGEQTGPGGIGSITAQEMAQLSGTIAYEVCTRIGERVPRYYIPNTPSSSRR